MEDLWHTLILPQLSLQIDGECAPSPQQGSPTLRSWTILELEFPDSAKLSGEASESGITP